MYNGHFFLSAYWQQLWANPTIDYNANKHKTVEITNIEMTNDRNVQTGCTSCDGWAKWLVGCKSFWTNLTTQKIG